MQLLCRLNLKECISGGVLIGSGPNIIFNMTVDGKGDKNRVDEENIEMTLIDSVV